MRRRDHRWAAAELIVPGRDTIAKSKKPDLFWKVAITLFPKPPAKDDSDQSEIFARVQRAIDMIDAQKGVEVRTQVIVKEPPKIVDAVVKE